MITEFLLPEVLDKFKTIQPNAEMKHRLIGSFNGDDQTFVTRGELIKAIYGIENIEDRSYRQKQSINYSLRKLLQRTRQVLKKNFGEEMQWLYYDFEKQAWKLCNPACRIDADKEFD